jgi:hypothetical protein
MQNRELKHDLVTASTYMFAYTRLSDIIDLFNTAGLPRAEMQVKGSSGAGLRANCRSGWMVWMILVRRHSAGVYRTPTKRWKKRWTKPFDVSQVRAHGATA